MAKKLVYLCGTMSPEEKYCVWRRTVEKELAKAGIGVLSPLRGADITRWAKPGWRETSKGLEDEVITTYSRGGFVARDLMDLRRADAVLLYFMEVPDRQSIGTWMEFGYTVKDGPPVIVCSTLPEVVGHPFVYKLAARIEDDLMKAVAYLKFLLM